MEVVKKIFFIFQQNWPFLGSTLRELTINDSASENAVGVLHSLETNGLEDILCLLVPVARATAQAV